MNYKFTITKSGSIGDSNAITFQWVCRKLHLVSIFRRRLRRKIFKKVLNWHEKSFSIEKEGDICRFVTITEKNERTIIERHQITVKVD